MNKEQKKLKDKKAKLPKYSVSSNLISIAFGVKEKVKLSGVGSSFNLFITREHEKKKINKRINYVKFS